MENWLAAHKQNRFAFCETANQIVSAVENEGCRAAPKPESLHRLWGRMTDPMVKLNGMAVTESRAPVPMMHAQRSAFCVSTSILRWVTGLSAPTAETRRRFGKQKDGNYSISHIC